MQQPITPLPAADKPTGGAVRRILVVDDNRAIHDDFRKVLEAKSDAVSALDDMEADLFGGGGTPLGGAAFEIDSAYQGEEALAMVQRSLREGRPYLLAFMDVRMPPGWDGIETTRRIWEIDPRLQVPLCTAYSDR